MFFCLKNVLLSLKHLRGNLKCVIFAEYENDVFDISFDGDIVGVWRW